MSRYYKIISVVCIFTLASIVIWVKRTESVAQKLVCTDIVSGCGNDLFKLKFLNSPQVMKPIRLQLETANARQVYASFAMERMEMGLNRYHCLSALIRICGLLKLLCPYVCRVEVIGW